MLQGHYTPPPAQEVIYGQPVADALAATIAARGACRVVFVTNTSLAAPGRLGESVRAALGAACVGEVTGIGAHSPRSDVIRLAATLAGQGADFVVALGGGSVCDAVKAATLCLANAVDTVAGIDALAPGAATAAPTLPWVAVPTTLSAGEFTDFAGVTDERVPRKEVLYRRGMAPPLVILDPAMTVATPPRLWFGTGIRAVDHAVETYCSVNATPMAEALALHALGRLPHALARVREDGDDLTARLDCQLGAWLSVQGVAAGVDLGASHGIGHVLGGTAGMPHGETSCVMLPHVLRYNHAVNGARQAALAANMGDAATPLADQVAALVAALGLPGRLRDADVPRERLAMIAEESLRDRWVTTNPRPLDGAPAVLALLEAAW
ncbi:MAG: iron-containing alcohol dehydrogenase [Gammaproteobacteria bacterium]